MRVFGYGHMMLVSVVEWVHLFLGCCRGWIIRRLAHPGLALIIRSMRSEYLGAILRVERIDGRWTSSCKSEE